jgi:hypothetical protein
MGTDVATHVFNNANGGNASCFTKVNFFTHIRKGNALLSQTEEELLEES